ncbi:MAG: hypothetical protein GX763_07885 [Clostridiaceae bacterium]|nr:hypothetical protein [Clostridiaceae bacterium]
MECTKYEISDNCDFKVIDLDEKLKELLDKQAELQKMIKDISAELDKVNEEIMYTVKLYMQIRGD